MHVVVAPTDGAVTEAFSITQQQPPVERGPITEFVSLWPKFVPFVMLIYSRSAV